MIACSINFKGIVSLQVASVQNYGAFVKIPGCSNQGLVHRSQISKVNVPDVSEVLAKGDRVWCKIVNTTVSIIGCNIHVRVADILPLSLVCFVCFRMMAKLDCQ